MEFKLTKTGLNKLENNGKQLSGQLLRTVFKTIIVLLGSISTKITLPNHAPSREMLKEYFSLSKLIALCPRVWSHCSDQTADVIMTVTYLLQMFDQAITVHERTQELDKNKSAFDSTRLSMLCLSTVLKVTTECKTAKHVNFAPMAHAAVSVTCKLKCQARMTCSTNILTLLP